MIQKATICERVEILYKVGVRKHSETISIAILSMMMSLLTYSFDKHKPILC